MTAVEGRLPVDPHDEREVLDAVRAVGVVIALSLVVGPWDVVDAVPALASGLVGVLIAGYAAWVLVARWLRRRNPARAWLVVSVLLLVDGVAVSALIALGDETAQRLLPLALVEIGVLAGMGRFRTALKTALWMMLCLTVVVAAEETLPEFAKADAWFPAWPLVLLLGSFLATAIVIGAGRAIGRTLRGEAGEPLRARPHERERAGAYLFVGAAALLLPLVSTVGPAAGRAPIGFIAALLAPGALLTSWCRVRDPLDELIIAIAGSLTSIILVTQAMLSTNWWHPSVLVGLTALAGLALLRQGWVALAVARSEQTAIAPERGSVEGSTAS